MQVKFFRASSGARIAYAVEGCGPPVVLLPAWSSHLELFWELEGFRRLCDGLTAEHTVVMYDRWGTGLSDRHRSDMSHEADVEVLADLVAHLRLRRLALFGQSHGAAKAAGFAAANPRAVSHLVLFGMTETGDVTEARWAAMRSLMLADWEVGSLAIASVLLAGAGEAEIAAFARLWRACTSAEVAVALNDAARTHDMTAEFRNIRVPTLVVSRRGDPLLSPERSRQTAAGIPGAELVILDGAAHLTHDGDVDAVVQVVLEFLHRGQRRRTDAAGGVRGAAAALTEREREVLDLVAGGMSNREISEHLVLSVRTVERHTLNIYAKLGVRGRAEAVAVDLHHPEPAGPA